jgi:hypothetical protein
MLSELKKFVRFIFEKFKNFHMRRGICSSEGRRRYSSRAGNHNASVGKTSSSARRSRLEAMKGVTPA